MITGKIYKFGLVVALIASVISCTKTDDTATPSATDSRDKLVGSWTCDENSQKFGKASYTISISKDVTSDNTILITNFYQLGSNTYTKATVDGNYITIPQQSVSGYSLKGNGTYNSNTTIHLTFTANDGQTATDNVTADCHH